MGIVRCASGKEGMLAKPDLPDDDGAAGAETAPAAGSVSSWGGNEGDMSLLTDTQ